MDRPLGCEPFRSVSLTLVLLLGVAMWLCPGSGATETTQEHNKRSLCNTFGGCGGRFHGDVRFTGRSFSNRAAQPQMRRAQPPYALSSEPSQAPAGVHGAPTVRRQSTEELRELPMWSRKYMNGV